MTLFERFRESVAGEIPVVVATVVTGPGSLGGKALIFENGRTEGDLGVPDLLEATVPNALRALRREQSVTESIEIGVETYGVFLDVFPAPPKIVIVGASHVAPALSAFAKASGYRVIVCDARAAFARAERFPSADQVLKGWPQDVLPGVGLDAHTYLVLLSHDPRFDEPTLDLALPSPVPYIGAIGSRRTQDTRNQRLREKGYSDEQIARIYGPVGLDIGSLTPEETALAILAEVTAVRRGAGAGFMRDRKRKS